jgi:hypothetical protein
MLGALDAAAAILDRSANEWEKMVPSVQARTSSNEDPRSEDEAEATIDLDMLAALNPLISAQNLAQRLGLQQEQNKVEKFLSRLAGANSGCREPLNRPRKGEPTYLYRMEIILPELRKQLVNWGVRLSDV